MAEHQNQAAVGRRCFDSFHYVATTSGRRANSALFLRVGWRQTVGPMKPAVQVMMIFIAQFPSLVYTASVIAGRLRKIRPAPKTNFEP
jgi:hypothetical protein